MDGNVEPYRDKGPMASKTPAGPTGNDQITCPCCGQMTTKTQAKSYIDSLPSSSPSPTPGMGAPNETGMDAMPDTSMARKFA